MTVKECRKKMGLSVLEMAKRLGITALEYETYEESPDTIPINLAILFSLVTGIPYDNIFFGINSIKME